MKNNWKTELKLTSLNQKHIIKFKNIPFRKKDVFLLIFREILLATTFSLAVTTLLLITKL